MRYGQSCAGEPSLLDTLANYRKGARKSRFLLAKLGMKDSIGLWRLAQTRPHAVAA